MFLLALVLPAPQQAQPSAPPLRPGPPIVEELQLADPTGAAQARSPWRLGGTAIVDLLGVASGGVDRELHALSLFALDLEVDLGSLLGWDGVQLVGQGLHAGGGSLSRDIGDLQVASNIEAEGEDAWLSAAYLEGDHDGWRWRVGKWDSNDAFAETGMGGDFVHSSFGFAPTIAGFPSFPLSAFGVGAWVDVGESSELGVSLFDGDQLAGLSPVHAGPGRFVEGRSELFALFEGTRRGPDGVDLSVGFWIATEDQPEFGASGFDGGSTTPFGGYVTVDLPIAGDERAQEPRADALLQLAWSDPDWSEVALSATAGLVWSHQLPHRSDDTFGLGVAWIELSEQGSFDPDQETAIEVYWRAVIDDALVLQPEAQWIVDPAADPRASDALVLGLRAIVSF